MGDSRPKDVADESYPELEDVDDSASRRFDPLAQEELWVPGLVEVEFKRSARSGVETWNFDQEKERKNFPEVWRPELTKVLASHRLVSWKPSFPLQYPWSSAESKESARESYFKAGRDKFVTFNFPQDANVLSVAKELRKMPEIERAVAVPRIGPPAAPLTEPLVGTSDQLVNTFCGPSGCLKNQWYVFRCGVDKAWNRPASGRGVTIADIDWGFNATHPDLRSRIELTRNMFPNSAVPSIVTHGNKGDHGTAVLGLAGAAVNDRGMAGIAFDASLWAIQAGTDTVENHDLWVAAINFVRNTASNGRKVIILEIHTRGCSNIEMILTINQEIIRAIDDGIVVCVPAGNGNASGDAGIGDDGVAIPETGSILVGATKFDAVKDQRANSNGGNRVVVYAPGDRNFDVTCGFPGPGYRNGFGGTSGATAKVAGVVALMLEKNDQLEHSEIREILKQSQKVVVDQGMNAVGVLLDADQAVGEAIARAEIPNEGTM